MDNRVSISRCESYDHEVVKSALISALAPIGGLEWVRPGMKIAVKANLLMHVKPEKAASTHPQVAASLCELLIERGAEVVVGDSPGGPFSAAYLATVYSTTGIREVLKTGATLNEDYSYTDVVNPDAVAAKEFQVTKYLMDADAIIDLCKVKTHGLMAYTGACKNLFGAVPGMRKSEYHYRYNTHEMFSNMLVDICQWCKPRLSIADGVMAMEGNGPTGGAPRYMGAIIASFNPHALDLAAAHLMNLGMEDVPTLRTAHLRGLVPDKVSELCIHGALESFVIPDFKLTPRHDITWKSKNKVVAKLLSGIFACSPKIDRGKCVGCSECEKICPAKAITIAEKCAKIDVGKCILCFCCQEFCPKGIIEVHRPLIARLLDKL